MGAEHEQSDAMAAALREYLAERDVACPSCSYNLRGLTTGSCPECNQPLVLGVQLAEPRLAAFVTAVVGLAAGAGFSGLLTIFFCFMLLMEGPAPDMEFIFGVTGGGFLIEGGLLALLVWRGRAVRRWSREQRWSVAGAAWLITTINLVVFAACVR